ncbi:MAG: aminoacyl-histidine dipeptidase, partial [Thermoplasmata archaeon]|nr:aminoacyl-histidine dipeptidase [Thermoplasmata archaeon]
LMGDMILALEPKVIWRYFLELSAIPRCSREEQAAGDYIATIAKGLGLDVERDRVGNVIVRKPASPGLGGAPTVVLQSHIDMVCEKDSAIEHDFRMDPIHPVIDGEWMHAQGTTLGADNGIGVATMLAAMEASFRHGPLEFVFTVDEETGLNGAQGISPDALKGRLFLNLDSEEEGELCIGCAGGADTNLTFALKKADGRKGLEALEIKVHGCRGGHSGVDIHEGRANAIKVLGRILTVGMEAAGGKVQLAAIEGGNKRNAIPREARAVVLVPVRAREEFMLAASGEADAIGFEFRSNEPSFKVDIAAAKMPSKAYDVVSSVRAIRALHGLPNGVMAMSKEIPGLVETSTNVGVIAIERGRMKVTISTRSSVRSALEWARGMHRSIAILAGGKVEELDGYPGWTPDLGSTTLRVVKRVHTKTFGKEPAVKAIHAGLECGLLKDKYPDMDMVSLGPHIENPHSPAERVKISSVGNFWRLLQASLGALAEEQADG